MVLLYIYQTLLSKATYYSVLYIFLVSMCVPLGIESTTFALLTQCSTTEPQEHYKYQPRALNVITDLEELLFSLIYARLKAL